MEGELKFAFFILMSGIGLLPAGPGSGILSAFA
jgi:hypothetical protein